MAGRSSTTERSRTPEGREGREGREVKQSSEKLGAGVRGHHEEIYNKRKREMEVDPNPSKRQKLESVQKPSSEKIQEEKGKNKEEIDKKSDDRNYRKLLISQTIQSGGQEFTDDVNKYVGQESGAADK